MFWVTLFNKDGAWQEEKFADNVEKLSQITGEFAGKYNYQMNHEGWYIKIKGYNG